MDGSLVLVSVCISPEQLRLESQMRLACGGAAKAGWLGGAGRGLPGAHTACRIQAALTTQDPPE